MKQIKTILLAQLALLGILLCISAPAWANLAANTQILNRANLSYWDGTQTKVASAEVTVTVTLVCAAPTLTPGGPQTTSYNGPGTTLTDSFTITSGSNGPDTYNLSAAVSGSTNTTGATAVPVVATVQLGATVTTVGSTGTVIVVPADGNLPGEMPGVNGIAVGDTVVINGNQRDVIAISDPATGTATITLNAALDSSYMPGSGVIVGERKTVNTTVTAGTITVSGNDVTVSDTLTATSCSGSGAATSPAGPILNTYTSGVGTLTKYVRNVTTPSGTGTPYIYNSTNYYLSGVTAKPGDTLEYVLVSTNSSLTGPVSSAVVTDAIPTAYVTFKTGVYTGSRDITYVNDSSVASYLTQTAGDDAGVYSAPNLTVNVGTTPGIPPAAGGTIPANKSVLVLYQVTVNP